MINYDLINGVFETLGAVATWRNYLAIRRDRAVHGVEWTSMAFFTAWGVWNVVLYSGLRFWWSTAAGIVLAAGNVAWLVAAVRLLRRERAQARLSATLDGLH